MKALKEKIGIKNQIWTTEKRKDKINAAKIKSQKVLTQYQRSFSKPFHISGYGEDNDLLHRYLEDHVAHLENGKVVFGNNHSTLRINP